MNVHGTPRCEFLPFSASFSQTNRFGFRVSRLAVIAVAMVFFAVIAPAQILTPTDAVALPAPGVGHDYLKMFNETVNPENGAVNLKIQIPVPPGRKLTVPFSIDYNSNQAFMLIPDPKYGFGLAFVPSFGALSRGGWSYAAPTLSRGTSVYRRYVMVDPVSGLPIITSGMDLSTTCGMTTGYNFTDAGGVTHPFDLQYIYNNSSTSANGEFYPFDQTCMQAGFSFYNQFADLDSVYQAAMPNVPPDSTSLPNNNQPQDDNTEIAGSDGTVYTFGAYAQTLGCDTTSNTSGCSLLAGILDRNGNTEGFSQTMTMQGSGVGAYSIPGLELVDSAGRVAVYAPAFGINGSTITVSGMTNPYTLSWASETFNGYSLNLSTNGITNGGDGGCLANGPASLVQPSQQVIQQIGLPNGQSYQFAYDPQYGTLSQITYPNGGFIRYSYGIDFLSSYLGYAGEGRGYTATGDEFFFGVPNACGAITDSLAVAHRYVSFDGTHIAQQQDFTYTPTTWNGTQWLTKSTTVTTHDLLRGTSFKTVYNYVPIQGEHNGTYYQVAVESSIVTYDTTGTVLKTVTKGWADQYRLSCEVDTIGASGPSSGVFYTYAPRAAKINGTNYPSDLIIDKKEYDYGQITPAACSTWNGSSLPTPSRETKIAYQAFGATSFSTAISSTSPPNVYSGLPGTSLLDRPCQEIVYDSTGTRISETDYLYDGGTVVCGTPGTPSVSAASTPQYTHNETLYGSASTTSRGNVTEKIERCFPLALATQAPLPAAPASCTDSTTTYTYDETGQLLSMTDANGNTTKYSYMDNSSDGGTANVRGNSDAYVTQITYPFVNVAHQENFSYNYATGQLASSTDENSQTTYYTYNDPLNRPTGVQYPDSGSTSISYADSSYASSVTTTKALSGSLSESTTALQDGMGHVIQTTLNTDPDGADISTTTYDGMGRPWMVSNPFRAVPMPTDGTSTYYYDALGRTVAEVEQDGSMLLTCYDNMPSTLPSGASSICKGQLGSALNASWVDSADETGRHWQRTSDSFGRLLKVMEPNASNTPAMETDYSYDGMNNLVQVDQWGGAKGAQGEVQRGFRYDSLGQLLSAYNPETGAVSYSYDPNGNMTQKTDARGMSTSIAYDALNRPTGKSYTGDGGITSSSSYSYDVSGETGATNTIGRLTYEVAYNFVSVPRLPGGGINEIQSTRNLYGYDPMGRLQQESQCTMAGCGGTAGTQYSPAYTYDLSGNLTSSTNGVAANPISLNYSYDGAAHLQTLTSTINNVQNTLFQTATPSAPNYDPAGHLTYAQLAINSTNQQPAFSLLRSYDTRERITSEQDTLGAAVLSPSSGSISISGSEQSVEVPSCLQYESPAYCLVYDTGSVTVDINGQSFSASYGQNDSSSTIASKLAADLNRSSSFVTATASGSTVNFTSRQAGAAVDYSTSASSEQGSNASLFSGPSFTASSNGSSMSGGAISAGNGTKLYSYSIPAGGYDKNSNLLKVSDSVLGGWSYNYDNLNRLSSATVTSGSYAGVNIGGATMSWSYDNFGNRSAQSAANTAALTSSWAHYSTGNNRMTATNSATGGLSYDLSGDVLFDGTHDYLYDAEGRICASAPASAPGIPQLPGTGYLYGPDGERVAKGTITSWSCSRTTNGFSTTENYILGPSNEQLSVTDGSGNWKHSNVYAAGKLLATYDANGAHYNLNDWLGTKRVQVSASGTVDESCWSQPFGDNLNCSGPVADDDNLHFTGKERDTESGNDYFEARYYGSSMGRFMSPDPSGGHTEDPQTLNKYSYVGNNPLIRTDPTGLDFNLQCSGNSATCHNGAQGTTSTDANGKSTFTATVISNGKDGGLVDQNGNKYNASVSGAGVSFSQDGSKQSSIGTFINGTNATTIQGSGALSGFTFNFTSSNMASNVNASGTFTYNGNASQATDALGKAGFQHYTADEFDFLHPSTDNYTAFDMRAPGGQGGTGAGHAVVQFPVVSTYGEGAQRIPINVVPTSGTLDLGTHNPWNGGFQEHFSEAWKAITK